MNIGFIFGGANVRFAYIYKISIIREKLKIKILALQFHTKAQWAHMSISVQSGPRALERLRYSKFYNVENWEI